jgi:hypothetical protein
MAKDKAPLPRMAAQGKTIAHDAARKRKILSQHELRYWLKLFNCSAADLRDELRRSGISPAAVQRLLRER